MRPRRYVPPRSTAGLRMPAMVRDWATLYQDGWSCLRIALDTGWIKGRRKWKVGTYSPEAVRKALIAWGVPMRKPGGRGSIHHSVSVRVAELEDALKLLRKRVSQIEDDLFRGEES